jgi:uncharacterized protein (DUF362 family)
MSSEEEITRRRFIELTGTAAGAAALGVGCADDEVAEGRTADTGGDDGAGDDDAGLADSIPDLADSISEDLSIPEGVAAVAIIGVVDDLEVAVRRAIELAGGIDEIQSGDSVFIKPNAVHPYVQGTNGIVTGPDLLAAVVRIVKDRNPGEVIVGDRSARFFSSSTVFRDSGLGQAALDAGADEVYAAPTPSADPDAWLLVQPNAWEETWADLGGILVMRKIVEADHFINVPVCKDHRWAIFSLSLKNNIGSVGDDSRNPMHYTNDPDRLCRDICILNQPFSPLINILDARWALINGGPDGIAPDAVFTQPGLVLASRDRIALDVTGAALLMLEQSRTEIPDPDEVQDDWAAADSPWDLPQIVHGIDLELGVPTRADDLLMRFEDVDDAEAIEQRLRA